MLPFGTPFTTKGTLGSLVLLLLILFASILAPHNQVVYVFGFLLAFGVSAVYLALLAIVLSGLKVRSVFFGPLAALMVALTLWITMGKPLRYLFFFFGEQNAIIRSTICGGVLRQHVQSISE